MDVPDVQGREEHFKRLLKKFTLAKPVEELAPLMARMSPGYSGADIENVVNEAALRWVWMRSSSSRRSVYYRRLQLYARPCISFIPWE